MSNTFHLAVPAGDLASTIPFYTEVLGCATGNSEDGKWIDINFGAMNSHFTKVKSAYRVFAMTSIWVM